MTEQDQENLCRFVSQFRLPRYQELPDMGLYLVQIVKYVNHFILLEEDKLTPSMVSNYVKQQIIPGPDRKSYSADAVAYLLFVAYTKTVVTLDDIYFMIGIQKKTYDLSVAYNYFCDELENLLQFSFGLRKEPANVGHDNTDQRALMRSILLSVAHKVYLRKYISFLKELNK